MQEWISWFKTILFLILCIGLTRLVVDYISQPDDVKSAIHGEYDPSKKLELMGFATEHQSPGRFEFIAFGFDQNIVVVHNFHTKFPTSKWHNVVIWGTFDNKGVFHLIDYRISWFQVIKYILSFIGLIWFMLLFFEDFKITKKGIKDA